jgi:hypothetical protein
MPPIQYATEMEIVIATATKMTVAMTGLIAFLFFLNLAIKVFPDCVLSPKRHNWFMNFGYWLPVKKLLGPVHPCITARFAIERRTTS